MITAENQAKADLSIFQHIIDLFQPKGKEENLYLATNLKALLKEQPEVIYKFLDEPQNPDYQVVTLANRHKTIQFRDDLGHSLTYTSSRPQAIDFGRHICREIESLPLANQGILFSGIADGHHILHVVDYFTTQKPSRHHMFYILEEDLVLLFCCFQLHDFTSLIQAENIRFFLGGKGRKKLFGYLITYPYLPRPTLEYHPLGISSDGEIIEAFYSHQDKIQNKWIVDSG